MIGLLKPNMIVHSGVGRSFVLVYSRNLQNTCRTMSSPGRTIAGARFCTRAIVPAGENVLKSGTCLRQSMVRFGTPKQPGTN